ncbi:NmrA-like family protein [Poriferisphaera corsica]|uniref:Divinyl chlorophyllide a 8-vinyl-reductase, chloroplastic n=1 Tax=Poriferisphaera corsica TaxID=2528020 RepID=A0A517YS07_9BACT|nr:SDR family oxidoreductase [Poriferisphaera corsica]QDU32996.1 NmrA-like family protein [Poriferisphaera corsica]
MPNILVAGATGYLGRYLVQTLHQRGHNVRALARSTEKLQSLQNYIDSSHVGQATNATSIKGICDNIDIAISSLGITRQKDGLTYNDVDYKANLHLLNEAQTSPTTTKFIYVSVLNAHQLQNLKMVKAKLKFENVLKKSGLQYQIIYPNGFFSDMTEFFNMAKSGTAYAFGDGTLQYNPIHGLDLANYIVDNINSISKELPIGGPEILTQNEITNAAFAALNKPAHTRHIPIFVAKSLRFLMQTFTSTKTHGPIEFFLTVLTQNMIAPATGTHTLKSYFQKLAAKDTTTPH